MIRVIGIFGYPIKHSLSPVMHNTAFRKLGLDFVYLPFTVKPENLGIAVQAIRALNFKGVNITVPHKEKVIKYLDQLDSSAKEVGAVNTIVNQEDRLGSNRLIGYNTDGMGFLKSLSGKINLKNKNVLLFGCGGAGKSIAGALVKSKIGSLTIIDPDKEKARATKLLLEKIIKAQGIKCSLTFNFKLLTFNSNIDLIINATPLGMHRGDPLPVAPKYLQKNQVVYDIVYNRETELLKAAKKIGARTFSGLEMLVYQGAEAFRIWTGKNAPIEIIRKAVVKELNNRHE